MPAQTLLGLALGLSLAMLVTARVESVARMTALQSAMVSVVVALHAGFVAIMPLALAASTLVLDRRFPARGDDGVRPASVLAGSVLALLALTFPDRPLALAIVVVGATMTAVRRSAAMQILGLVSLQNGVILAATDHPAAAIGTAIAMLPAVPALAAAGLWLSTTRQGAATRALWPSSARFDSGACSVVLALSTILPWLVPLSRGGLRIDAFAATMVPLLAVVATASGWAQRLQAGDTVPPAGARLILVLSAALAVLLGDPMSSWLALAIATLAAAALSLPQATRAWRQLRLGGLGLGLALAGMIAVADSSPGAGLEGLWPPVCLLVGLGIIATLGPELALTSVAVAVRHLDLSTGDTALEIVLMAAGLAAIAIAGGKAWLRRDRVSLVCLTGLGQAGVTLFAFGLDTPEARFAALMNLVLLGLAQSGLLLAAAGSPAEAAATAGLGGVPPFGTFPALALIIAATATRTPWMLLPLGAALGFFAWPILARLARPADMPGTAHRPYAWAPLVLALLVGFALPQSAVAWLQSPAAGRPAADIAAGPVP